MCDNTKVRGWIPTADMLPRDNREVIGLWLFQEFYPSDYDICHYTQEYGWEAHQDERVRFRGAPDYWMHLPPEPTP